ncbi:MAG: hypothetical protein Q611_LSC00108G0001 [Leuconostoc sp. DORA_2]|jgi:transcriptional regulator with XRE-family HTH domain|nr:MAG: hypothetical protein Q611_LSC00108G0001 [Leuconostoc sp. DORA_2]
MRGEMMTILLPTQLKRMRTERGLSQEDIANQLFVSRQAISRWESGDATPDLTNLVKLAEILETSLDSLVLGTVQQEETSVDVDKIDKHEFMFDPRTGKYIRRRMNFWQFLASYWWIFLILGGFLSSLLLDMLKLLK